jgi:hypothetical protein
MERGGRGLVGGAAIRPAVERFQLLGPPKEPQRRNRLLRHNPSAGRPGQPEGGFAAALTALIAGPAQR